MADPAAEEKPFLMYRPVDGAPEDSLAQMTAFARRFPSLADAEGVEPWNPELLSEWVCREDGGTTAAQLWTVGFLLGIWDHNGGEELFDLHAAVKDWDEVHLEVFLDWCRNPWWPELPKLDD